MSNIRRRRTQRRKNKFPSFNYVQLCCSRDRLPPETNQADKQTVSSEHTAIEDNQLKTYSYSQQSVSSKHTATEDSQLKTYSYSRQSGSQLTTYSYSRQSAHNTQSAQHIQLYQRAAHSYTTSANYFTLYGAFPTWRTLECLHN